MADRSMNFCYAPWTNLEILPNGDILPCCKFQPSEKFNIQTHTIQQYLKSDYLHSIKQQFEQGQWPSGCIRCKQEESIGTASKRQLDYQRWKQHYNNYDFDTNHLLTVSIALGNTCNLKCVTCGPHASSRWVQEFKDIYGIVKPNLEYLRQELITNILELAPDMIHIDFHGGEPLLSNRDRHYELLDNYIHSKRSSNISLHYTTNATILPNDELVSRWQQFKNVDIQLSVDGIGLQFEYIRYPATWIEFQKHAAFYQNLCSTNKNFTLSLACTVSAFNIYYLDQLFTWCYNQGLPMPWTGKLQRPSHLRATVWSTQAKQYIVEHLNTSEFEQVKSWAKLLLIDDNSQEFELFKKYTQTHDAYRGISFGSAFEELSKFL